MIVIGHPLVRRSASRMMSQSSAAGIFARSGALYSQPSERTRSAWKANQIRRPALIAASTQSWTGTDPAPPLRPGKARNTSGRSVAASRNR